MNKDSLGNKLERGQLVQVQTAKGDLIYGWISESEDTRPDMTSTQARKIPARIFIEFDSITILSMEGKFPNITVVKNPKEEEVPCPPAATA